jgi:hypothetical protein
MVCPSQGKEHAYVSTPDAEFGEHAFSEPRAHFQGIFIATTNTILEQVMFTI